MLVSRILTARGAVAAYVLAFVLFAAGSLICAASPGMLTLLVGRAVQGLGGGLLAGLGYALIQRALPERLWARGSAVASAMWGVGNLAGPAAGGAFAQVGAWRAAFVILGLIALAAIFLVFRAVPRTPRSRATRGVPVMSLALLSSAVAAVSVAGIVPEGLGTATALAAGLMLAVWFITHERSAISTLLPAVTFGRRSSLPWVYLTVGTLGFGIAVETFIPLFGQEIGALPPLVAGFLGAAPSLGWSLTQLVSANAERRRTVGGLMMGSPIVLAAGLTAYGLLQSESRSVILVGSWFVVLFLAGSGIGLAFPHLMVAALRSADGDEEGAKAASGINTVLIVASAIGAASAGVLVNLGFPSTVTSAHYLMFGFAVLITLGVLPARAASR
jgi:MFS family permease